ncbi:MAG: DUF1848 domain-containing protein [Candidatus Azobacteroides sp.]|nr:DUF1848 domain-containing protein [Candidatus Azobacteroides sp.]
MILSASRRCDIPAFFSEWFFNRLDAGEFLYRNPLFPAQVLRVKVSPEEVDCIVFWSKNPYPIWENFHRLEKYKEKILFQYTITGYDASIEKQVPPINQRISVFKKLADTVSPEGMIWRYDPIIYGKGMDGILFDEAWHLEHFAYLCRQLETYTSRCIFSFLDIYQRSSINLKNSYLRTLTSEECISIAGKMAKIARESGMTLETCAEKINLSSFGIQKGACISAKHIEKLIAYPLAPLKDKGQRPACGCIESVDIGMYDCCLHGCLYCYATSPNGLTIKNAARHDPTSPFLIGNKQSGDQIKDRKPTVLRMNKKG